MTKTHFEKIDDWNLVEPTITNFDKALDKWMGGYIWFSKKSLRNYVRNEIRWS